MNRKILFAAIVGIASLIFISLALGSFERALDLYQRTEGSPVMQYLLLAALLVLVILSVLLLLWMFKPIRRRAAAAPITEPELRERMQEAQERGINTAAANSELEHLQQRRAVGELYICVFGEISAGKSSLMNALLPEANQQTDVRGGTTRAVSSALWQAESGDRIRLVDVPGVNDNDPELARLAREEATRAHIVVYLCSGDLSRSQWQELELLHGLQKPMVVALNKTDRYSKEELATITSHIEARLQGLAGAGQVPVVQLVSGGVEKLRRVDADGNEQIVERERQPQLQALLAALQTQLANRDGSLDHLRDQAVLAQVAAKLEGAEQVFVAEQAQSLVRKYTASAVVGALAAISPGSDIVIQGVLATKMVRSLCDLYGVPARDVEAEKLLTMANRRLAKSSGLALAVTGNAFKAFPGIGTVAGGLMHAVAYGLLFDSFGRALAETLAQRGKIEAVQTVERMEALLNGDVLPRAKQLIQLALAAKQA